MTSVRQQIWQVAASYAPFVALVTAGTGALYGSDTSPDPPPQVKTAPWFYLELLSDTESFSGDRNYRESGFRWWGYDVPNAGYVRLRRALGVLAQAPGYIEQASDSAAPYEDTDTGEVVFWQRPSGFGSESGDQVRGLNLLTFTWQTRKRFRGAWP